MDPIDSFPKIIHQTWRTRNLSNIEEFRLCAESWRSHHPDFEYRLWEDRDNAEFLRDRFADYLETWASFDKNIKRIDTIRYMWMYVFGGVYADLDMECLRSLAPLIEQHEQHDVLLFCDLESDGRCLSANPALIVSKPGCPFWLEALEYARAHRDEYVTHCSGPYALGHLVNLRRGEYAIRCLDQNALFIRKSTRPFYTEIAGNEHDHWIYDRVYAATEKPRKYFGDRTRKYVADWHGTPAHLHWRREYDDD